ncbi:MAG TPA: hypothetical protein VN445_00285 [Rectinemataceae bacterium]|nr:hypothetical protein [Rectinemataceae bacterium]
MKKSKWTQIIIFTLLVALGIGGGFYSGYWAGLVRDVSRLTGQGSTQTAGRPSSVTERHGDMPGVGLIPGDIADQGVMEDGTPSVSPRKARNSGFNAAVLPKIAGYGTVLALFAAIVQLFELVGKKRGAAGSTATGSTTTGTLPSNQRRLARRRASGYGKTPIL